MPTTGSFPRGGKKAVKEKENEDDDLFKVRKAATKFHKAKKGKKVKIARKPGTNVEVLTFQALREGVLLLGRVKEVHDFKVMVSLPHGLLGTLPVVAVSLSYTQRLQAVADAADDDDVENNLPTLKDLFRVGDGIGCRVTAVNIKDNKRFVQLTSYPSEVNKDLPKIALKTDCVLYGAVQSVEDHGFKIDIGVPGIQAFLPLVEASPEGDLTVGKCLWVRVLTECSLEVMTGETRVVRVSMLNVLEAEVGQHAVTSVECLHPGMKVKGTVEKVLKDGIYLKVYKYKGCVCKAHLPHGVQFVSGQQVEGRVLYVHPASKIISLSLLPGLVNCIQPSSVPLGGFSIGEFAEAEVLSSSNKGGGVFFRLDDNCLALASLKHLSDEKVKDVHQTFPTGSKYRCRVIGFQPADDLIMISLKESVMNQKILSINDIQPGQVVECTVEAVHESGVIVMLGKGLTGLVPKKHVAEIHLKDFSKKFKKGDPLKCMVLKVDSQSKKVYLSHKKSLVNASSKVPTSYAGLQPDMHIEGYVIAVKDNGVAVGFCSDVKGWVPLSELSTVEILHPETAFHIGQVVRCRVIFCHPEEKKLRLSFIISGRASIASKAEKMENFEVGKLLKAIVTKRLEKNLELQLLPSGAKALMPREHLADSKDNQMLLWRALEIGDSIAQVMLLKQTNVTIVTMKESFLSAARAGLIPKSAADLEPGQLLPGVIRNHQIYGIFVELPGGLGGLAPRKFTTDHPANDLTQLFACSQSVVVKVMEVKEDKGRFLCSLRLRDCYSDDPSVGLEILETFLNERNHYINAVLDTKAEGLKTGSIVKVTVKERTEGGYLCETNHNMMAIAPHFSDEAELGLGEEVEAVVLHVAFQAEATFLQVSLDTWLVKSARLRRDKPTMDRARVGQAIKGRVVMITDDFVLVALKQHAAGTLAWLPRRQHLNDVQAVITKKLTVGEEIKVSIQKIEGDRVLAILASQAKDAEDNPLHTLHLGDVVAAQVQTILPGQMNIIINGVKARVHVTEVLDDEMVSPNIYPFVGYKKGQDVKVKIIGFRHFRSFKFLPISHPRIHRAMPECTLKPSKLSHEGCPLQYQPSYIRKYEEGDRVVVYSVKFENNKLWVNITSSQNGVVSVFDLSRDLGVLKHAEKNFLPGHAFPATVLGVEEEGLVHLTLTGKKEVVKKNEVVTGKVTSVSKMGLALRLPGDFRGMVPLSDACGDTHKKWSTIAVGSFLRCLVLFCKDKERCVLSLSLKHRSEEDLQKVQKQLKGQNKPCKKRKRSESEQEADKNSEPGTSSPLKKKSRPSDKMEGDREQKGSEDEELATGGERCLQVETGFVWEQPKAPGNDTVHNVDEDNDEEMEVEKTSKGEQKERSSKKRKKKTSSADLPVISTTHTEQSHDYERRLISEPNNSKLWIEYMCQQINEGKVDKARSIGNQALQTIAFEKEEEKLNVWTALLNLENQYGSPEEMTKIMQKALKVTDPIKLYRRVASLYAASGKIEEAEQVHLTMKRKFKQEKQMWTDFAYFLYKQGRLEAARSLLQQSLKSLQPRDHVGMITKFATLEGKFGDSERASTMLEKTITEYPKRSDVMSVYIDLVVKLGQMDRARELFERAVRIDKSSKFFYKKYLQFEEMHGTPETLERLRQRIADES